MITTGSLNTGEVVIMNGEQPTFRWDAKGLTAFDFITRVTEDGKEITSNFNTNKGVRFDRFGICGFNGVDGQSWSPNNLDEIRANSNFALNWDGLFLKMGSGIYNMYQDIDDDGNLEEEKALDYPIYHRSNAILGRTNGVIYNDWTEKGFPYYNPVSSAPTFTKIFAVGSGEGG
jgi:hypothetical protein